MALASLSVVGEAAPFYAELLAELALRNRARLALLWPTIARHLQVRSQRRGGDGEPGRRGAEGLRARRGGDGFTPSSLCGRSRRTWRSGLRRCAWVRVRGPQDVLVVLAPPDTAGGSGGGAVTIGRQALGASLRVAVHWLRARRHSRRGAGEEEEGEESEEEGCVREGLHALFGALAAAPEARTAALAEVLGNGLHELLRAGFIATLGGGGAVLPVPDGAVGWAALAICCAVAAEGPWLWLYPVCRRRGGMAGEGWGEIFRLVERLALVPSHAAGAAGAFAGLRFVILETQHAHAVLDQVPAIKYPPAYLPACVSPPPLPAGCWSVQEAAACWWWLRAR
eukprot:COSAG01_NODE_4321_length_5134_cov_3.912612_4_plen_339_part_00